MKYIVVQKNADKAGNGEYIEFGRFDDLSMARKHLMKIRRDFDHIDKHPCGYLETLVKDAETDEVLVATKCKY